MYHEDWIYIPGYDILQGGEIKKRLTKIKKPCWDGYEMIGMKEKDGREVPNCVPIKDKVDFNKIKWGTFTTLFKRYKKEFPDTTISNLKEFAKYIVENPTEFSKKAHKKALFYMNVIDGGDLIKDNFRVYQNGDCYTIYDNDKQKVIDYCVETEKKAEDKINDLLKKDGKDVKKIIKKNINNPSINKNKMSWREYWSQYCKGKTFGSRQAVNEAMKKAAAEWRAKFKK